MTIADIKKTAEQKMGRSIEAFKSDLQKIRTGRAHAGLLDQVHVEYYGSQVPISQVANVTLLDARTISVQPWEKGMGAKIERAIRESDLGLNPSSQGDLLRVPMPALTEERRKELTKVVRHAAEEAKIAVRNLRRDANEHAKRMLKDKAITEDEERRSLDELQKLTDRTIGEIDRLTSSVRSRRRRCRATSRSSWTATAAGPRSGTCRASSVTSRASMRSCGRCTPAPTAASST
jgi:ribosome recycling factor